MWILGDTFQWLKNLFFHPKTETIIRESLADAERKLLEHQSHAEYHKQMVEFYSKSITRLSSYNPLKIL